MAYMFCGNEIGKPVSTWDSQLLLGQAVNYKQQVHAYAAQHGCQADWRFAPTNRAFLT